MDLDEAANRAIANMRAKWARSKLLVEGGLAEDVEERLAIRCGGLHPRFTVFSDERSVRMFYCCDDGIQVSRYVHDYSHVDATIDWLLWRASIRIR